MRPVRGWCRRPAGCCWSRQPGRWVWTVALSAGLARWRRPSARPRPGQDRAGSGAGAGAGRGLPGRCRAAARRAGRVRAGGLRPDRLAHDRRPGRGRARGAGRDRRRPCDRPGAGVGAGRPARTRRRRGRDASAGHRRGRHAGDRALATRSAPPPRSSAASGSTRCGRSSTTGRPAPGSRWRCCCGRATPGRTPPPTTSR